MNISSSFKSFLFMPLVVICGFNIVYLLIGLGLSIFIQKISIFVIIYIALFVLLNIFFVGFVIFVSNKFILVAIINSINDFYNDMRTFYENNKNGFNGWSQRILTSPREMVDVSNYFHNNIGMQVYELNKSLNEDELTGLRTSICLKNDLVENPNHVIAVLNISNFKEINSFYGVQLADEILCSVANMLKHYFFSENYLLYRIYGDDFAILWPNCTDRSIFISKLEKFLDFLSKQEIVIDNYTYLSISATIGVSFSYDSTRYNMVNALMALHHAKEYKNPIVIYNKNLPILNTLKNNVLYTEMIHQAIKNDNIIPFYQRIAYIQDDCEHDNGKIKFETLMRLIDNEGHIVPPGHFLDVAKRSNAYSKLSRMIIEKSFQFLAMNENYIFSVNLALEDMNSSDFSIWFMDRIVHYNLEGRVVIEITEQESLEDFESVNNFITNVKELGVRIALDDFGSGYANFALLMKLQINYLKIDGSLIKNIDKDVNAQIIVETIVRFSKSLKIYTIAEFVSSQEIYDIVKKMGVDYAQGYYISKPVQNIVD